MRKGWNKMLLAMGKETTCEGIWGHTMGFDKYESEEEFEGSAPAPAAKQSR